MPVPCLIHTGKGVSRVFCHCLVFKTTYLLVFPEGKDNGVGHEEAKVQFVVLRKSSWVTLKWHSVSVPQFPTSKMRIVAALTERCAGRTQNNIYEVFEYHSREGRGAQKHIRWQIYVSFTVICMSCSLCHASSTDLKIKNSMGASKEPDSFLKWVRWHANPLIVCLRVVLFFLMDRAKKQVEQVWMTPSYDMSDTGMCDGAIKQNCTSRSSTWGSYTMGGKKKKWIKGA